MYRIEYPGCTSCYVGQITRHLITRLSEHVRRFAPLGQQIAEFGLDEDCDGLSHRNVSGFQQTFNTGSALHHHYRGETGTELARRISAEAIDFTILIVVAWC